MKVGLFAVLDRLAGWWLDTRTRQFADRWRTREDLDFRVESLVFQKGPNGKTNMELIASMRSVGDFASHCATLLEGFDAENFVTLTMQPRPDHGTRPIEVTVRYITGKPVSVVLSELSKDLETMRVAADDLRNDLIHAANDPRYAAGEREGLRIAVKLFHIHRALARKETNGHPG